jgi:hypothetical protein
MAIASYLCAPVSLVCLGDVSALGAPVPEASIYKNSNSFPRKEEVWNAKNALLVHFPPANCTPNKNSLHPQLCGFTAGRANRAHIFASARADILFHSSHLQIV